MRTTSFAKVAALCGLLALSGCASKITQPDKYSGFLKITSSSTNNPATGKPVLRWVDPSFDQSKYDSIVWNPITYCAQNLLPGRACFAGFQLYDIRLKKDSAERLVATPLVMELDFRVVITRY